MTLVIWLMTVVVMVALPTSIIAVLTAIGMTLWWGIIWLRSSPGSDRRDDAVHFIKVAMTVFACAVIALTATVAFLEYFWWPDP